MNWILVTPETMPEEKKPVLVYIKNVNEKFFYITSAHVKKNKFYLCDFHQVKLRKLDKNLNVTH
jgi:hypothetical protein